MRSKLAGAAGCVVLLTACAGSPPERGAVRRAKPSVYVVNYPLQYFAGRVGGDLIEVHLPAPADVDPAYWEPDAATVEAYQNADLILLNGASYAKWVEMASLPLARTVDTSAAFRDRYIEIEGTVTHSHGPGGKHAHGGIAFTTWLDPALAAQHAEAIGAALRKLLPEHETVLASNLSGLKGDLQDLDAQFRDSMKDYRGQPLLASHPVYQYLARAYQLNLESVHWEPNEMPGAEEWRRLDDLLKRHPAKWMIWEATPADGIAVELRKRGIGSVVFSTCANVPPAGDYLSVMKENVERLRPLVERLR